MQSHDPPSARVGRADQEPRRGPAHRHRGLAARMLGALRGPGAHALPNGARALLRCPSLTPRTALLLTAADRCVVLGWCGHGLQGPAGESLCTRAGAGGGNRHVGAVRNRVPGAAARRQRLGAACVPRDVRALCQLRRSHRRAPRRSPARASRARPAPAKLCSGAAWSRGWNEAAPLR